ncbi:hypothetical protein MRX96_025644 [Rhipicephalus microplus]
MAVRRNNEGGCTKEKEGHAGARSTEERALSPRLKTACAVGTFTVERTSAAFNRRRSTKIQDHWELHSFVEVGSYAEATPRPNEVSYISSAVSVEIPAIAVHPLDNVIDRFAAADRLAAAGDLIRNAQMGIQHIEHNLALCRAGRELERRRFLQAERRVRSLCEDLSSEPVPLQLQLSILQYEPSRDQEELAAVPPADCPVFGDTDEEEDF